MIELGKTEAQNVMYGVLATLVNITISYDKQEINHEMWKLLNVVKHHILWGQELDEEDFAENLEYCPVLTPARILTREIFCRASIHHHQHTDMRGSSWRARVGP
jgi:hypothetical protein